MSIGSPNYGKGKVISMSDFVDFVTKSGQPRVTLVKNLIHRPDYDPKTDYYRCLREAIKQFHGSGSKDRTILISAMKHHVSSHKGSKAGQRIDAYLRFIGKKKIEARQPPRTIWEHAGMSIRVNPELDLEWNGVRRIIKMFWKDEPIRSTQVTAVHSLMWAAFGHVCPAGTEMVLLHVPTGKMYSSRARSPEGESLLRSEALAMASLWEDLADPKDSGEN